MSILDYNLFSYIHTGTHMSVKHRMYIYTMYIYITMCLSIA